MQVSVAKSGPSPQAGERARKQSEFCTALLRILDVNAPFGLIQRVDDALAEAGLVGIEFYNTKSYDDIDYEDEEFDTPGGPRRETKAEKEGRIREARRQRKLPVLARYVDPASLRFEMDEGKPSCVLICEKKRWRLVRDKFSRRFGDARDYDTIPQPGDAGTHGDSSSNLVDYAETDDVDTIRWYDDYWYAYVVAGELVECEPHGFPEIPVGIGTSRVTSSSNYNEMFQGVTWGRSGIERLFNDLLNAEADVEKTYHRPKPVATTDNPAATGLNQSSTVNIDLSTDDLLLLPPGYKLDNAFKDFRPGENSPVMQILLSLFQMGGMSPAAQGDSPGSDVSGYLFNSVKNAGNAKYEGTLDNKCRLWQWGSDFYRRAIKEMVGEEVELQNDAAEDDAATWLSLGPADIDDTPSVVKIDPLDEQNRMALAGYLMQGMQEGVVPLEEVVKRGYGAQNVNDWMDRVALGKLQLRLQDRAVDEALTEVDEEAADRMAKNAPAPTILGPDGLPLPPSPRGPADMPSPAEMPRPPGIGGGIMAMQESGGAAGPQSAFRAGMRPVNQGVSVREAVGNAT